MTKQRHPFATLRILTVLGCLAVGGELLLLGGSGMVQAQLTGQGSRAEIVQTGEAMLKSAPLIAPDPVSYRTQMLLGLLVILLGLGAHLFFKYRDRLGKGDQSVYRTNAERLEVYRIEF